MKKKIIIVASVAILFSCNSKNTTEENKKPLNKDIEFNLYKEQFILSLWKLYPGWASSQGFHNYDSVLIIPNEIQRNLELTFSKSNLDSLKKYPLASLSSNNKTDYYMIENQLKTIEWSINNLKSYQWNPSEYNVCGVFSELLNNNYDSLDLRLHNFGLKLKQVPNYYEEAKKQIKNPTIEHTELAISQNIGGASVFNEDITNALQKSKLPESEKNQILTLAKQSFNAVNNFAKWLKELKHKSPRSFRLGKELYTKKFELDIQSGYTAEEIYNKAIEHKKDLHKKMFALANQLWPKYVYDASKNTVGKKNLPIKPNDSLELIKQVINALSLHHVKADSFQTAIEQQIPVLTNFIKQKNLIFIDSTKPLVVRKEPAYMAGLAGASISSPGPYDKNGNTYYNVGSFGGWDKNKIESYLREYNHYILQILNIHEAIPGHYTQLVYANQSPSIIKAIFGNGAMIEGWAVYTERMMLENGYPNLKTNDSSDEMWLMYYKWNLRTTCNTILDYGVHVNNLSKEEGIKLLTKEAFQQQAEAEGKWRRVTLSQVQLCSYFTGYKEIYDFREELKKQMGNSFNLKQFHEQFLSYGSAPVKYIKELMAKKQDDTVSQ